MHYLDNAATTPVNGQVIEAIQNALERYFANPSSLYLLGYEAERAIEKSRAVVAKAMGCSKAEVYFTASGSEGNNMAILGAVKTRENWGNHVIMTGYEHPSVANPLLQLATQDKIQLTIISPNTQGEIDIEEILKAVRKDTILVCAMHVNNETGAIIDVAELAKKVKEKNARTAVHVDGVQGFTKVPVILSQTQIDSYAVSGHKLNAPKGIGALYLRKGYAIDPIFFGGGQEKGIRPGTENTPYIVGFAKAVDIAVQNHEKNTKIIKELNKQVKEEMQKINGAIQNSPENGYEGTVNYSIEGIKSETLLHFLEEKQVYVSSGSACGKGDKSHTLTAMQLPADRIDSAIRISFNGENTKEDITALVEGINQAITSLARKSK